MLQQKSKQCQIFEQKIAFLFSSYQLECLEQKHLSLVTPNEHIQLTLYHQHRQTLLNAMKESKVSVLMLANKFSSSLILELSNAEIQDDSKHFYFDPLEQL